jgi:hypothetical protein
MAMENAADKVWDMEGSDEGTVDVEKIGCSK